MEIKARLFLYVAANRACLDACATLCSSFERCPHDLLGPSCGSRPCWALLLCSRVCGRTSAEVLLVVIERQFVNQLQKRIVGLIWEQYVAAAAFAHWLFSNEHSLDFDGSFLGRCSARQRRRRLVRLVSSLCRQKSSRTQKHPPLLRALPDSRAAACV